MIAQPPRHTATSASRPSADTAASVRMLNPKSERLRGGRLPRKERTSLGKPFAVHVGEVVEKRRGTCAVGTDIHLPFSRGESRAHLYRYDRPIGQPSIAALPHCRRQQEAYLRHLGETRAGSFLPKGQTPHVAGPLVIGLRASVPEDRGLAPPTPVARHGHQFAISNVRCCGARAFRNSCASKTAPGAWLPLSRTPPPRMR